MITRRSFVRTGTGLIAGTPLLFARRGAHIKVGVTDWNLRQTAKLEAVGLAKSLGFDGIQVSLGRDAGSGKLPLDDAELQKRYVSEAKSRDITINSTCLDILHVNYLKNDKLGQKWVTDGIRITKALQAGVMLLPFFGKGALTTPQEMDYVGDALRELAPEAEKAKVTLGLEDTISAPDNLRIMERSRSSAVKVYYDIGNSTHGGFDIVREINLLGKKNICEIHLKDNPNYLGEGKIDLRAVMHALNNIDYDKWAVLETDCPSRDIQADMRRNLTYVRQLMSDSKV